MPEQATGGFVDRPIEARESIQIAMLDWGRAAQILASLAGVAVLVGAAAFLTGWVYTDALYERLGIPTRAMGLGPADYATARVEIWLAFALAAVLALADPIVTEQIISWHEYIAAREAKPVEAWIPRLRWSWVLEFMGGLVTLFGGTVGVLTTGEIAFLALFAVGAILAPMGALWGARHRPRLRPVLLWFAAFIGFFAFMYLLVGADRVGRHDAVALLSWGCDARLVAPEPLGLPGEYYRSGGYVTGCIHVIRATGDTYLVAVWDGIKEVKVYSLPAARVLRMEYTPD